MRSQFQISTEALQKFLPEEASHYRLLPCRLEKDGTLVCLGEEGCDYSSAVSEIAIVYGYAISIVPVPADDFSRVLATSYRKETGRPGSPKPMSSDGDIVEMLIREAYEMRASDIHLEPSDGRSRVRFRVDGKLLERHVIGRADYPGVVNRIKILSSLDISEKRLPQDGRIVYDRAGPKFDIRTSVIPTIHGEKIVLRLLTQENRNLSLDSLGFNARQLADYKTAIGNPHGMVLISGPTGSGKSTTLYATLELLNREDNNILTIEDPVEYTLAGINQVQLKEEIGLGFTSALRAFLRQDPDIIMLGEIRDEDTAEMAVRSSMTGHLVLSTLHTNSAWGCITRLTDMGVHPYLLAESLLACVAQRLVRVLCPHCKREIESSGKLAASLGLPEGMRLYERGGCEHCFYTGYHGRRAIYEVILIDDRLAEAIRGTTVEVDDHLKSKGIKTLRQSALSLLVEGVTSVEEVLPLIKEKR